MCFLFKDRFKTLLQEHKINLIPFKTEHPSMKEMIAPQVSSSTPSQKLAMRMRTHSNSHVISKLIKPKIRVIHIFAPHIITTDAANFREVVQKLTGKSQPQPHESERKANNKKSASKNLAAKKSMQLQDDEWLENATWYDGDILSPFLDGRTGFDSSS